MAMTKFDKLLARVGLYHPTFGIAPKIHLYFAAFYWLTSVVCLAMAAATKSAAPLFPAAGGALMGVISVAIYRDMGK